MAFYHKYRPHTFNEVAGQTHIVELLRNSLPKGPNHAYLMVGPHGTGKTTVARLIAASVNCLEKLACGKCETCRAVIEGRYPDLVELDAASNRGIDDIKGLIGTLNLQPIQGKYKTFIIDEVHMLTDPASNALLKSLEEPPSFVVFVLATTEEKKVLPTIRSRCQVHRFRPVGKAVCVEKLKEICRKENLSIDNSVADLICEESKGSVRDAVSLLELVSQLNVKSYEAVAEMLGRVDNKNVVEFLTTFEERDLGKAFRYVNSLYETGKVDMRNFRDGVVMWLRGLLLVSAKADYVHPLLTRMRVQSGYFTTNDLLLMAKTFMNEVYCPFLPTLHLELAAVEVMDKLSPVVESDF